MGLRLRLLWVMTAIFFLAIAVTAALLVKVAQQSVIEEVVATTDLAVQLIDQFGTQPPAPGSVQSTERWLKRLRQSNQLRHVQIQAAGMGIGVEPEVEHAAPEWFADLVRPPASMLQRRLRAGAAQLDVIADPSAEIEEAWREVRTTLMLFLIVFAGANIVLFLLLGRALGPLSKLSSALTGIEHGEFGERLQSQGIREIDELNDRFNAMAASLQRSKQETAYLAQRSLAIQEEERHFLARELHDDMGQSITAIKALAVSIRERADDVLGDRASTIIEVSSSIYDRVRQMMTRLHPSALDELGLTSALELMVDDWNEHHGDSFCRFTATDVPSTLEPDVRINLYRIVQEALTNVAKHAPGAEVTVDLELRPSASGVPHLVMEIADNGPGFDPANQARGLGLLGMRERANSMSGDFQIVTQNGRGTRLLVDVPFVKAQRNE